MRHFLLLDTMSKTVKTSLITLALLLFWMFTGIFSNEDKNASSIVNIDNNNAENSSALVSAKVFNAKPKISFVVLRGRTEADRNVFIAAETTGIIENIYFEKGEKVKKGDIICIFSSFAAKFFPYTIGKKEHIVNTQGTRCTGCQNFISSGDEPDPP